MTISWKSDFPALKDNQLAYLDSASSCQLPQVVIDAVSDYWRRGHGNPQRGLYPWSERATDIVEHCRSKVASFINANTEQIAFSHSTTESINLVATSLNQKITPEHSILVTQMEHHANLLPWQRLCEQTGARLNILSVTASGELDLSNLETLLADNCVLFAFSHCSNVSGWVTPAKQLISAAKKHQVLTLIDGAQIVAHQAVDVTDLGCDFYALSGHKLYAPSGIGMLYCRKPESVEPLLLGGGIVTRVTDTSYALRSDIQRLEAGSANMPALVGLTAALDYIQSIGLKAICRHKKALIKSLTEGLDLSVFELISHSSSGNLISIKSARFHSHDIATVLAENSVAVRAGHHCAQPYLTALASKHCVRLSVGVYNTMDDIERAIDALNKVPLVLT